MAQTAPGGIGAKRVPGQLLFINDLILKEKLLRQR
jgi:hypothetical protein